MIMAGNKTAKEIQEEALGLAIAKAQSAGLNYIYTDTITEGGESITGSYGVSYRFLDQNRYLYCDEADVETFKAEHRGAVAAGYIVYDGDKPDFITNADKYVDNNVDVFMRKGHYEGADFYQTPVPSYIDSDDYDESNYDTNENETVPLYYVSDEIKLDEGE
jgi:hypothetical protein